RETAEFVRARPEDAELHDAGEVARDEAAEADLCEAAEIVSHVVDDAELRDAGEATLGAIVVEDFLSGRVERADLREPAEIFVRVVEAAEHGKACEALVVAVVAAELRQSREALRAVERRELERAD